MRSYVFLLVALAIETSLGSNCPTEGSYCQSEEKALSTCQADPVCAEDLKKYNSCLDDVFKDFGSECEQFKCLDDLGLKSSIWSNFIKCGKKSCHCDSGIGSGARQWVVSFWMFLLLLYLSRLT
jgi:hypothetical protein